MNLLEIKNNILNLPVLKETLMNEFKKYMEKYGLRPGSAIIGVSHASIYKIINDKKNISLETLATYVLKFIEHEETHT